MVRMRDRSAEITETTAFDVIQDRIARRDENAPGLRVPHAEWLVLDDLHVLAGKPVTQAEVGRLLEAVVGRGARVVCASGGSPTRIPVLADAVQRLSAGRVIEMEPPTPQEMRRIIAARAAAVGLRPGGASLALLADEARGDVRCAIGGLTRLRFAASARAGARLT